MIYFTSCFSDFFFLHSSAFSSFYYSVYENFKEVKELNFFVCFFKYTSFFKCLKRSKLSCDNEQECMRNSLSSLVEENVRNKTEQRKVTHCTNNNLTCKSFYKSSKLIVMFFLYILYFDVYNFFSYAEESYASRQLERLYCGQDNCYSLLELKRNATYPEIRKAYLVLSFRLHPDKNKSSNAIENFRKVAKAYQVLTDKEVRKAYDYYLDHPNDIMSLLYGIQAVYPQRTNPVYVIIIILAFISLSQFFQSYYQFYRSKDFVMKTHTFKRAVATQMNEQYGGKLKKMTPQEQQIAREAIENIVLSERVEINGKIAKLIEWKELYAVKFVLLPFIIYKKCKRNAIWIWRFYIKKEPYGILEKEYMTYTRLNMTEETWKRCTEEERKEFMDLQLWENKNYELHKKQKDDEEREKRVNSTKYKQWKRWKKKYGDMSYNYND